MANGQEASNTHQIQETLIEMCRPFGSIEQWTVESDKDGLYRCVVRLDEPEKHRLVSEALGGEVQGQDVCLEIRVR